MTRPGRRLAALLVLVIASSGTAATNLAYGALDGEWVDRVTLGQEEDAVLRRLEITITAEALPETEGLLSGGTYGPVTAHFPAVEGLEVALIDGTSGRPTFQPAGEHVLLDSATCQLERACRRTVSVVMRLVDATEPVEVEWSVRGGVYVPGGQLPDGAELTVGGMDGEPAAVAVHEVPVELDGNVAVHPKRALRLVARYAPARGTRLRLHNVSLGVTFDGARGTTTTEPSRLTLMLRRRGGGQAEEIPIAAGESASRDLQPLSTCLAGCTTTYRVVLRPADGVTDPPETATWTVRGWLFVLADPGSDAPTFEVLARRTR